jgi:hypothetical protein
MHLFSSGFSYGYGSESDMSTSQIQRIILSLEKPDLVVFSGDLVSASKGDAGELWKKAVAVVNAMKIPYAIT